MSGTIDLEKNHEYKFKCNLFFNLYGIVLDQEDNWVQVRYTREARLKNKVAWINLNNVKIVREV